MWQVKLRALRLTQFLFLLQIFPFASPIVGLIYYSAVSLSAGFVGGKPYGEMMFGARVTFGIGETTIPNGIMLNAFALVVYFLVKWAYQQRQIELDINLPMTQTQLRQLYSDESLKSY